MLATIVSHLGEGCAHILSKSDFKHILGKVFQLFYNCLIS